MASDAVDAETPHTTPSTRDAIDATHSRANAQARDLPKQGVVFATYASLLGKKGGKTSKPQTRLDQLLEWASPGFEVLPPFLPNSEA